MSEMAKEFWGLFVAVVLSVAVSAMIADRMVRRLKKEVGQLRESWTESWKMVREEYCELLVKQSQFEALIIRSIPDEEFKLLYDQEVTQKGEKEFIKSFSNEAIAMNRIRAMKAKKG